jgi:hypothetical protein
MAALRALNEYEPTDEEMARAKKGGLDADARGRLIDEHAGTLAAAGCDKVRFQAAVAALEAARDLVAADVIEVARRYVGGSKLPSKPAAMRAIQTRFLERVRAEAKGKIADKARPW